MTQTEDPRRAAFVSYSRKDRQWAGRIHRALEKRGVTVWRDATSMRLGRRTTEQVEEALSSSSHFLFLVSRSSRESNWCQDELAVACDLGKVRIPVELEASASPPMRLRDLPFVSVLEDFEAAMDWIATEISGETPRRSAPKIEGCHGHPQAKERGFVGRRDERRRLSEWIRDPSNPLMIIQGLGGLGKTHLAQKWLREDVDGAEFELCYWSSFYETEATPRALAARLLSRLAPTDVSESPDGDYEALRAVLASRRVLLICDGFERALEMYQRMDAAYVEGPSGDPWDSDEVSARRRRIADRRFADLISFILVDPSFQSKVLVTSREVPLDLENKEGCNIIQLAGLSRVETEEYLRGQGITGPKADFERLWRDLRGHALSVGLLARRILRDPRSPGNVGVWPRYDVQPELKGDHKRHHVLSFVFEALSEPEIWLIDRLAAFRGSVSFDTLQDVFIRYADLGDVQVLERALLALVDAHLVDQEGSRYDLHPIVRRYAYERLTKARAVHDQLKDVLLGGDELRSDFTPIAPELERYIGPPPAQPVRSLDEVSELIELYHQVLRSGFPGEAIVLFRDRLAYSLVYSLADFASVRRLLEEALFGGPAPDGELRPMTERWQAWAQNLLANCHRYEGSVITARRLHQPVIDWDRRHDPELLLPIHLVSLALDQLLCGDFEAAHSNLLEASDLSDRFGIESNSLSCRLRLAELYARIGDTARARTELERAEAIPSESHYTIAIPLTQALVSMAENNFQEGSELAHKAMQLADRTLHRRYQIDARLRMLECWRMAADHAAETWYPGRAERILEECRQLERGSSLLAHRARMRICEAAILEQRGEPEEASELIKRTVRLLAENSHTVLEADALLELARTSLKGPRPDFAAAREYAKDARTRCLERIDVAGVRRMQDPTSRFIYRIGLDRANDLLRVLPAV